MNSTATFLDGLLTTLDAAIAHPADNEVAPIAILWPDETGQWAALISQIRDIRPVLTLGPREPTTWAGPAYWIRCIVDGTIPGPGTGEIPIIYLPGHARPKIRAVEEAPSEVKPLAELQYRGVIFAQSSGRDWTLAAFLQAPPDRGGLGIKVAADEATKTALRGASDVLADELIDDLRRRAPLGAAFFNGLKVPDLDRDVLRWLNDPEAFLTRKSPNERAAFTESFKNRFGFELMDGEFEVARRLGARPTESWNLVWQAYADAPGRYPRVEERLRAAKPAPSKGSPAEVAAVETWPQDNEAAEADLRVQLKGVATLGIQLARARLIELDGIHADRRRWPWARLGKAPLAFAVEILAALAQQTRRHLPAAAVDDIVRAYASEGWKTDDSAIRALASVEEPQDIQVVGAAIAAVYREWLEVGAERFQAAVTPSPQTYVVPPLDDWPASTAVIFTDGLRYDVGRRLADHLEAANVSVEVQARLTALPTITPTAKPAASPAISRLSGGPGLSPVRKNNASVALSAEILRKEIAECGYQILGPGEVGDPAGRAWAEQGDIDKLGHDEDRLAPLLDQEVHKLDLRIRQLLDAGWARVVVVTDHGWLYLPGGLPKADLPLHLAKDGLRKSRAARLEDDAKTDIPTVPWFWDPTVKIAMAPGIRTFSGSPVYDHGGISPQECITPVVIATSAARPSNDVGVEVTWAGLRARISASGAPAGGRVDLRQKAGDPTSSVVSGGQPMDAEGRASLLVANDEFAGTLAFLLILGLDDRPLLERTVTIGGND